MARKPRKDPQAEFHHITNQGARKGTIYFDNEDKAFFVDLLNRCNQKHGMLVHAKCLMGNHYHILGQFPDRNMSVAMHWIGTCFSQYINRKYEFTGRLCRDRFFSNPIDSDPYLLLAARYIHRNPMDLGVTVGQLATYAASSYGVYLGLAEQPPWMRTDLILGLHSNSRDALREFTERSLPIEDYLAS